MKNPIPLILLLSFALCLFSCKKESPRPEEEAAPAPAPAPTPTVTPTVDPYTYSADLKSSQEISLANMMMADIEMMCAYLGEGQLTNTYFEAVPNSASSATTTCIRDLNQKMLVMAFNKALCRDGRTREGAVFFSYKYDFNSNPDANSSADFYRDYGFVSTVITSEYKVNDWKVELFDPAKPAHIYNLVSNPGFNPATENLSWKFAGKFRLSNQADGRVIIWDAEIVKTLTNTGSTLVFAPSKQSPINWSKAIISYGGTVLGSTPGAVPFNYFVNVSAPLIRDFNCSFTPAASTATEFHPFIKGVATFSTSVFHPRTIDHGPAGACDNSGTISFKDEVHAVTFD